MNKSITITLNSDGTWGSSDMSDINERASEANLEQLIADAVAADYPGFDVEVSSAQVGRTEIVFYDGTNEPTDNEEEDIRETIGGIWETWDWVVYK